MSFKACGSTRAHDPDPNKLCNSITAKTVHLLTDWKTVAKRQYDGGVSSYKKAKMAGLMWFGEIIEE